MTTTPLVLGVITEDERQEIWQIWSRKTGLSELANSLATLGTSPTSEMYERLVEDMGRTQQRMQDWWKAVSARYQWPDLPGHRWSVDFDTRQVSIYGPPPQ